MWRGAEHPESGNAMKELVDCRYYEAPGRQARVLLVMLPGAGIAADEFAEHGMVASVHELGLPVDIAAAHPDLGLYLDGGVTAALHRAVVEPALARGFSRIWLLGISLGGMGALLYASAYPDHVEGIVLLAPFLGTKGTTAELVRAGGLSAWSPAGSIATEPEQRLLLWLQGHLARRIEAPVLYLGYGQGDRFADAHRTLATELPADRVLVTPGGHDWPTWAKLWRQLLARAPFRVDV